MRIITQAYHSTLPGLTSDDHTQYALLAGRSGGQTLTGGTGSGDDLTLLSTSHGTKGSIILGTLSAYDEVNDRLGLGTTAPGSTLDITKTVTTAASAKGAEVNMTYNPSGAASGVTAGFQTVSTDSGNSQNLASFYGQNCSHTKSGTTTVSALRGVNVLVTNSSTGGTATNGAAAVYSITLSGNGGTTTNTSGLNSTITYSGTHTSTNSYGNFLTLNNTSGTVTTARFMRTSFTNTGTLSNMRQIELDDVGSGATYYTIYSAGDTKMYHEGSVGIGQTTPGAKLDVEGDIIFRPGTSTTQCPTVGVLKVNTTAVGNVGTGEDNLITYSMGANTLGTDNDAIEITAFGTLAANFNLKKIKLYFGATQLLSFSTTNSGDGWWITATVIRTGATAQIAIANERLASVNTYSTPAETLSGAVTIKCTGEGTSDNDIIQKGLIVKYLRNN